MKIFNKRASFDYEVLETIEAGIVLSGGEAKAARMGQISLTSSYVKFVDNEAYLLNANIPIPGKKQYDPTQSRKLLLHKSQILNWEVKMKQRKLTVIPLSVYNSKRLIKLEIALAKSKKTFQKKEKVKQHDIQLDIEREYKNKI